MAWQKHRIVDAAKWMPLVPQAGQVMLRRRLQSAESDKGMQR
jgi:hypothetical protein